VTTGSDSSTSSSPLYHEVSIVPALQEIQERFGYLDREALKRFSEEAEVPLQRLQAVASFFPHFRLTPPAKVVLRVCRDMACHMAGSAEIISKLESLNGDQVTIKGASCMGRCDRAPAACVAMEGLENDQYYLARSSEQLRTIVTACLADAPPKPNLDRDHSGLPAASKIDPYAGAAPDYAGVRKAVALRDASLAASVRALTEKDHWSPRQIDQFRLGAVLQMRVDFPDDPLIAKAVRCWQTESDWAAGPELGGWSEALLKELKDAKLRGMGGAGIPAANKWHDVRDAVRTARNRSRDDRAFIVVNGDESEPGTFKDRELLLRTPHLIVEGVIIAGMITEATEGFIYIRHEYGEQIEACRTEIRRAEQLGVCGENAVVLGRPFRVSVFVSPGGYICGEQSALIEAMSDRRGEPRNMPPTLETNGLQDLPTLISNVETFAWVPFICIHGGKAYANEGVNTWHGRRLFSVSGDVNRPGVYEVPMGLTLRELIYGEPYCQGITGNRALKGFAPSGPSGGFLPATLTAHAGLSPNHGRNEMWQPFAERRGFDVASDSLDILDMELELDLFRAFSPTQALGAGLVVYAEGRDMAEQAVNAVEFFRNESCGKCVPCRLGSQKFASLGSHLLAGKIGADRWNKELLPLMSETGEVLKLTSICGLGRSVPMPLGTVAAFFEEDLARHLSTQPASGQPKKGNPCP
jgi:NADH:ubiquinone oxidoreductase subunit F (NADH-binding)/NADH:ubiquinone oxidoreductase subunit E